MDAAACRWGHGAASRSTTAARSGSAMGKVRTRTRHPASHPPRLGAHRRGTGRAAGHAAGSADGAIGIAEMLFCTSLVAQVGAGEQPSLSPRRLQLTNTKVRPETRAPPCAPHATPALSSLSLSLPSSLLATLLIVSETLLSPAPIDHLRAQLLDGHPGGEDEPQAARGGAGGHDPPLRH